MIKPHRRSEAGRTPIQGHAAGETDADIGLPTKTITPGITEKIK